ncbi:MAG: hypothetical protein O2895_00235 [Chloroflexi bacterium]|nr:hypothetical protein [Chloroflexota bacterium]
MAPNSAALTVQTSRIADVDLSPRVACSSYKRERWDHYHAAAETVCKHSHSDAAPWLRVSGEQKRHPRIAVLPAALAPWREWRAHLEARP